MKTTIALGLLFFVIPTLVLAAESTSRKLTCCEEAAAQGRECLHRCCVTAHRAAQSCTKCNPAAEDLNLQRYGEETFYFQLIRGTDGDKLPAPGAKPIGLELKQRLQAVFKWKAYWELKHDSVVLAPGKIARRRMSPEREVEIERLGLERIAVRIYLNGTLSRSRTQPAEGAFCVTGGEVGADQSWFIVVRRDRPMSVATFP